MTDFPEHTRTRSFPITPSSPSSTIKICHQYPCDSRCHRLPFFSRVWHTARLYKLRDTQRSVTDRTKTYCALRRSSEEWATYWFHPPWFVHSRKFVISIQGQQSCSDLCNVLGFQVLLMKITAGEIISWVFCYLAIECRHAGRCCWCIDCAARKIIVWVCVYKKTWSVHLLPVMNYNK